jgi:hypothetical protein
MSEAPIASRSFSSRVTASREQEKRRGMPENDCHDLAVYHHTRRRSSGSLCAADLLTSCRHGGPGPAEIPWASGHSRERAHGQRRRNGCRVRRREWARNIVGKKTPGRLLSGTTFRVKPGYILGLPMAAYLTWQGKLIEGKGETPSVPVELSPGYLFAGYDPQRQAVEVVSGM